MRVQIFETDDGSVVAIASWAGIAPRTLPGAVVLYPVGVGEIACAATSGSWTDTLVATGFVRTACSDARSLLLAAISQWAQPGERPLFLVADALSAVQRVSTLGERPAGAREPQYA